MPVKLKTKAQKGIQVEFAINDVKGNYVGDFIPECTVCRSTHFEFDEKYTTALCVNCHNVVARRTDVYPEPEIKIKGRKVIGFTVDVLGDFKWVCSTCGNDLSFLMKDLSTTTCTECLAVTSRNQIATATVAVQEAVTWSLS